MDIQNALFEYFLMQLDAEIIEAKKRADFDYGIREIGLDGQVIIEDDQSQYILKHATGNSSVELHNLKVDRGISWENAVAKLEAENNTGMFFKRKYCKLVYLGIKLIGFKHQMYQPFGVIYDPWKTENVYRHLEKISTAEAEILWKEQYEFSATKCSDLYTGIKCMSGIHCETGTRHVTYSIISGSLLSIWDKILVNIENPNGSVVRVKSGDLKFIGLQIDNKNVQRLHESILKCVQQQQEEGINADKAATTDPTVGMHYSQNDMYYDYL